MEVKIQKLRPGAVTPRRGSADAAGYDLYACPADGQCVTIAPHVTAMIGTGLALAIPAGYFGGVFARSRLNTTHGLRPASTGLIGAACAGVMLQVVAGIASASAGESLLMKFSWDGAINWRGIVLALALLFFTRCVKKTKDLHPIVFIGISAVIGVVFRFAGV